MEVSKIYFLYILGAIVLLLFCFLLFFKEQKFDAPLLGLFTMGVILFVIAIFKPNIIKFGDIEIQNRIEKIEEELRPYAIITFPKREIVFQNFLKGEFKLLEVDPKVNTSFKFLLKRRPRYLEVRSSYGGNISVEPKETSQGFEFLGEFKSYLLQNDGKIFDKIIIEAFF